MKLVYLGEIPYDAMVPQSVRSRTLVVESAPGSEVGKAFVEIAGRLTRRRLATVE